MVSLQRIFVCFKSIFWGVSLLVMCVTICKAIELKPFPGGNVICSVGQKACCIDGKMQCVADDAAHKFCLIKCADSSFELKVCSSVGAVEYKTDGDCGTLSRTCCDNEEWSGWGGKCCSGSSKPSSSQKCGTKGTQTRSVTCDTNTGNWNTGSWTSCVESECSIGETKKCPSNSRKIVRCMSNNMWSSTCECENPGNGKVYCQGMFRPSGSTCYHGIWSDETCSGICCCSQDIPKLMDTGSPGCYGTRANGLGGGMYMWQYSCQCAPGGSGGV